MTGVECRPAKTTIRTSTHGQRVRNQTRYRGFTLAELLTVLAIIALLAALLLPVLPVARQSAYRITCLSRVRQLVLAQRLYLSDWDDRFPNWYISDPPRLGPNGYFHYWTEYFQPYLHSAAALRDRNVNWKSAPWMQDLPQDYKLADYVLATWGTGGKGSAQSPYWTWPGPSFILAEVRRPAESIGMLDGFTTPSRAAVDLQRHAGGLNVGFVDGHACWLPTGELQRIATDGQGVYWYYYSSVDR
jgi:prepilin-type N-terminal cleavage/methylation domain-containing protein/prepilin-type processing-associated H-X9-DG protein